MTVIIKEGEWLTHEGGDRYARALRDIELHSYVKAEDFELADGSKPQKHSVIPADVVVTGPFASIARVNVNGEWRDLP